jgi:thioredoxin-related protein
MRGLLFLAVSLVGCLSGMETSEMKITKQFSKAMMFNQVYEKPLMMVFLGGPATDDGLNLMNIIKDKAFSNYLGNKIAVYLADLNYQLFSKEEVENYEMLIKEMHVSSFPTVILVDKDKNEITRLSLPNLKPRQFAERIEKIRFVYDLIRSKLPNAQSYSLLSWYKEAAEIGALGLQKEILQKAFSFKEIDTELKIENYLHLIREHEDEKIIAQFKEQYLTLDFAKNPYLLDRISLIDLQFNRPMTAMQIEHLSKDSFASHLVQIPN